MNGYLRPSVEFFCDIATSNVVSSELVSKALLSHKGEHPVALYTQQEWDRRVSSKLLLLGFQLRSAPR